MRLVPNREEVLNPGTSEDLEVSGFMNNWNAALGLTLSEDLPIVSRFLPTEVSSSRDKRIHDYLKSGDIPYSVAMFYGDDKSGLAGYARDRLGLPGFFTDEEYQEQKEQEYKQRRDYSQSVFEDADWLGKIGQLAGTAHAYSIDPVYAISALTGYGTAATIGRAMLVTGAVEAGVEAIAQPFKAAFKHDIGVEYGASQALTEIAFSGLGGAAVAGILKGVGNVAGKALSSLSPEDLTVKDAIQVFEKLEKDVPEMDVVLNTLRHADPNDNLAKVLEADEAIDARRVNEGPLRPPESTVGEARLQLEEQTFLSRQPLEKVDGAEGEGVPRGTPTEKPEPDLRHPMVVEADDIAHAYDQAMKTMEDCF